MTERSRSNQGRALTARSVISGADLTALRPLLSQATSITLWGSVGKYYHVFLRPLLPDQNS